jgi:hypothetical protein
MAREIETSTETGLRIIIIRVKVRGPEGGKYKAWDVRRKSDGRRIVEGAATKASALHSANLNARYFGWK